MTVMLMGLIGFIALHSVRIVAPAWREAMIARFGEGAWKGIYSLLSIAFFVLLVWGYGQARQQPQLVWLPPPALRHIGYLLVAASFVLLAAAAVLGNAIKAKLHHPMILAVKVWAFAHLLMVGWLHAMIVFAALLAWAIVDFASARRRPEQPTAGPSSVVMTALTIVLGVVAFGAFALWLHRWLIGVAPFGL